MKKNLNNLILLVALLLLLPGCKGMKPQYKVVFDFITAVSYGDVEKVLSLCVFDEADPEDKKFISKLTKATEKKDIFGAVSAVAKLGYSDLQSPENKDLHWITLKLDFCVIHKGTKTITNRNGRTKTVPDYRLCAFENAGSYQLK